MEKGVREQRFSTKLSHTYSYRLRMKKKTRQIYNHFYVDSLPVSTSLRLGSGRTFFTTDIDSKIPRVELFRRLGARAGSERGCAQLCSALEASRASQCISCAPGKYICAGAGRLTGIPELRAQLLRQQTVFFSRRD